MDDTERMVYDASRPTQVIRRGTVTRVDGYAVEPVTVDAVALLVVQPAGGSSLRREVEGDGATGAIAIWSSGTALALTYDSTDPGKTPLGWTALQAAPATDSAGPPGDIIVWNGRRFEVTTIEPFDGDGLLPAANIHRYRATERKVTP